MYITIDEYSELYDPIEKRSFNRLAFDACRVMDIHTTGIDGLKKLKRFFPTDADDAEAVKRCAAKIINLMHQIQSAEESAMQAAGYESTESGMRGKIISSVSAGNESISYATSGSAATTIDIAVKDKAVRDKLVADTVRESLSGISDANGVKLLYMGEYPRRYLC